MKLMNRLIALIKIDLREGNDSRLKIKKFSQSLKFRKLKQAKMLLMLLLQRPLELLVRKKFDADSTQAATIKIVHSFILQKSVSFSQNAPTARDVSTFTQTANLEPSVQIKLAISNTKAKEQSHNR
jgi:hypothetical protein